MSTDQTVDNRTMKESWEALAEAIFEGRDVSKAQYLDMKMAFYAGGLASHTICMVAAVNNKTIGNGAEVLQQLEDELSEFLESFAVGAIVDEIVQKIKSEIEKTKGEPETA